MAPIRLLLVDDHPLARAGTHSLLEGEADFVVVGEAADGEAALTLAERIPLDIVVLDLHLPGLSGVDVARRLRDTLPDLRIVVLTGYAIEPYMPVLRRLGVEGYLAKSASAGELATALRAVYAGRHYIQPELAPMFEQTITDDAEGPTARELEVLRLVATGSTNREIAQHLAIRERTVEFHLDNLFRKLGASSRTEAVHLASGRGWLAVESF
jgi:DNA-binding NarL/FixJ family response regulator